MSDEIKDSEVEEIVEEAAPDFDLNMHTARLLMNEPFFAALSRRIEKVSCSYIPTAGVRVNPHTAQLEMLYNPAFFGKLTDKQVAGILKHEFYHIIFEHITERKPDDKKLARMWNFATDLAINSHLRGELPEGCLMPGEGPFKDMPPMMSSEYYMEELKKRPPEDQQGEGDSGEGEGEGKQGEGDGSLGDQGQFDSHEEWDKADAATKEIAKERVKDALRKAAEESAKSNSWGSVSSDVRKQIMKSFTSKIDWKKVLRYFVKTSQRANKSSTIKRINRRYPYIHPGRKTSRQAKIAISIDQSGSVSDDMLAKFFAELNKLADLAEFTVIPFDSDVAKDKIYVWKKGEKRKWERVRYGGTDFDPPTEYVNENGFDGHIVLTDMCAPKPKPSKCQRMWMTTEYYSKHPYFQTNERVIAIDD